MYIGSSINIGNRLVDHLVENNTNEHLQNALLFNHYGIENFVFVVVEVFIEDVEVSKETNKANLLAPPRFFFLFVVVVAGVVGGPTPTTPCYCSSSSSSSWGGSCSSWGRFSP